MYVCVCTVYECRSRGCRYIGHDRVCGGNGLVGLCGCLWVGDGGGLDTGVGPLIVGILGSCVCKEETVKL